jgi:hypothetical protein
MWLRNLLRRTAMVDDVLHTTAKFVDRGGVRRSFGADGSHGF